MSQNNIKPSEISDVLLKQLESADLSVKFEEVGTVLQEATVWPESMA